MVRPNKVRQNGLNNTQCTLERHTQNITQKSHDIKYNDYVQMNLTDQICQVIELDKLNMLSL